MISNPISIYGENFFAFSETQCLSAGYKGSNLCYLAEPFGNTTSTFRCWLCDDCATFPFIEYSGRKSDFQYTESIVLFVFLT